MDFINILFNFKFIFNLNSIEIESEIKMRFYLDIFIINMYYIECVSDGVNVTGIILKIEKFTIFYRVVN